MEYNLNEIFKKFGFNFDYSPYGNGHINDTYLCDGMPKLILQKINSNVFKNPESVMENIYNVTEHLKKKITQYGGDPRRETLNVIRTTDGKNFYKADDNNYFRMYYYVDNSLSFDYAEDPMLLYHAGKAFGKFQRLLDDFPIDMLHETIIDFHNTPIRVHQLEKAKQDNIAGRINRVSKELEFADKYSKYASLITDSIENGTIPMRVTHNDTKLNNVLFDNKTKEGLCVIDLDTVMPGSALYDFGDALRFAASSGAEDEKNLDLIWFDLDKFEFFAKGFLEETKDCLTPKEIELLPMSVLLMTYECGTRFLADYLNGDTYFKIHYENHNLDRARTQFKLVKDIESKFDIMHDIIKKLL